MEKIISTIKKKASYIGSDGRSEVEIAQAEAILGNHFAADYREYLLKIGIACFDGRELTGLSNSKRLNVVDVTLSERSINPTIPRDWYVLEEANIDGIVIWQSGTGEVFQTQPGREAIKLAVSICDYLELL